MKKVTAEEIEKTAKKIARLYHLFLGNAKSRKQSWKLLPKYSKESFIRIANWHLKKLRGKNEKSY